MQDEKLVLLDDPDRLRTQIILKKTTKKTVVVLQTRGGLILIAQLYM
jgi:hypothetical protein